MEKIEVFTYHGPVNILESIHTCARWVKTSIFSIFQNDFENEEKHHIFTSGQLKYKIHSFGWKICTCVNWAKNVDRSAVGENFLFFEKFSKMKKSIIFSFQDN